MSAKLPKQTLNMQYVCGENDERAKMDLGLVLEILFLNCPKWVWHAWITGYKDLL